MRAGPIALLATLLWSGPSAADGELNMRGVYYKEQATRVIQPMMDASMEVTPDLELEGHMLIDAITSASVAAGTDGRAFTENRFEGGLGGDYKLGQVSLGGFGRYSREPDYRSLFGGVRGTVELAEKNTVLGLVLGAGTDHVTNAGARFGIMPFAVEGDMTMLLGSVSVTQLLSPQVVAGITYDAIHLSGFLENAYRPVSGGGESIPLERLPATRMRHAVAGSVKAFLPMSRTTLVGSYRLYVDDWELMAHTPEFRLIQEIVPGFFMHLRYRYHNQGDAYFYKPIYETLNEGVEPYVTEDVKLSAFDSHIMGFKLESTLANLGVRNFMGAWRVDVLYQYVFQNNRFGDAVVLQTGLAIPFEFTP